MSNAKPVSVGIVSAGMYLPEPVLTAADIAAESGLPEWVVRDKLGIHQKHMAGPDDHPNEMAIRAALDCLSKTDIQPEEIDVVLCTTEEWREYLLWTIPRSALCLLVAAIGWEIWSISRIDAPHSCSTLGPERAHSCCARIGRATMCWAHT